MSGDLPEGGHENSPCMTASALSILFFGCFSENMGGISCSEQTGVKGAVLCVHLDP